MTAPSDLIRRGDVLKIVFPYVCSEALKGALCLHPSCDNVRYSPILDALRALPADPVAEAARKLAEAYIAPHGMDGSDMQTLRTAGILYRRVVAARDAGKGAKP